MFSLMIFSIYSHCLSPPLADLRLPLKVTMVNAQGLNEPGIDGGGVFREFLSELLKTGFDPNHGYFMTTEEGQLYPNPQVVCVCVSPCPSLTGLDLYFTFCRLLY